MNAQLQKGSMTGTYIIVSDDILCTEYINEEHECRGNFESLFQVFDQN